MINDFYKQFIQPEADDPHYVSVSRLCVVLIMVCAGVVSLFMNSISGAWKFLIALNAGIGLVQILRWYWWRIVFSLPKTKDNFALKVLIIVPVLRPSGS